MSKTEEADVVCCANCGITEVDDIKLEECDGCDLVKYCSDKCQENHREQHEEECNKRKALLHDRKLFTQPDETHLGECPICFLPLSIDRKKSRFYSCCSNVICQGCVYANYISNGGDRCSFCREPISSGDEETRKRLMKRVKANDPAALTEIGGKCYDVGDYHKAFEYFTKAAKLGDAEAHFNLGFMYYEGGGLEKDEEMAVYHYEKAAVGGHAVARHNLAVIEERNGNWKTAVKHDIIAAHLGYDESMKALWDHFKDGNITKEDLDATLRANQAAIDETKSAQRDMADIYYCN
jgi:TPR repeat protein